jgi:hypothetical protein
MPQASCVVVDGVVHEIFRRVQYNLLLLSPLFRTYLRNSGGRETPAQTVDEVKLVRYKPQSVGNCTYVENK